MFGDPLGNATGDTVIATQHARFLPQLTNDVRMTVWTGNPEIWNYLCPEVTTVAFVSQEALSGDYDVVVFASTPVPETHKTILRESGVVALWWFAGNYHVSVALGDREAFDAPLPPFLNHTTRVSEVYGALGWDPEPCVVRRSRERDGVVYFNPYASRGWKSLSPGFCRLLLAELDAALDPTLRMIVPARPRAASADDDAVFARLAESTTLSRARAQVGAKLDRTSYFSRIERSRLVVGPDTSSQHIAAAFGVPSIACYPSGADAYYLSWGPVTATSLHFTVPEDRSPRAQRGLSSLIVEIARRLTGSTALADRTLLDSVCLFTGECRRYLRGRTSSRRAAAAALRRVDRAVPAEWSAHLVGELRALYDDLLVLRSQCSAADRRVAIARVEHLNTLRVARIFAAPASPAEPVRSPQVPVTGPRATPRSSAGPVARSSGRGSRGPGGRTSGR